MTKKNKKKQVKTGPIELMPVNTKSMFAMLCNCMVRLDNDEIDVTHAHAMSKLIGQANNLLNYELKRAALMCNSEFRQQHRSLEIKPFDRLPESSEPPTE